jgi:hypothetical protein
MDDRGVATATVFATGATAIRATLGAADLVLKARLE